MKIEWIAMIIAEIILLGGGIFYLSYKFKEAKRGLVYGIILSVFFGALFFFYMDAMGLALIPEFYDNAISLGSAFLITASFVLLQEVYSEINNKKNNDKIVELEEKISNTLDALAIDDKNLAEIKDLLSESKETKQIIETKHEILLGFKSKEQKL